MPQTLSMRCTTTHLLLRSSVVIGAELEHHAKENKQLHVLSAMNQCAAHHGLHRNGTSAASQQLKKGTGPGGRESELGNKNKVC